MVSEEILLIVKLLPISVRAGLNLVSAVKRVIKTTLVNNPKICPQLRGILAVQLGSAVTNLSCINPLSRDICNFQALVGLGLSVLTALILSQNPVFNTFAILSFIIIFVYYFMLMDKDIEEPSIKGKHIPFTLVCFTYTVIFILVSTIVL